MASNKPRTRMHLQSCALGYLVTTRKKFIKIFFTNHKDTEIFSTLFESIPYFENTDESMQQ